MTKLPTNTRALFPIVLLILLNACGGGGSGGLPASYQVGGSITGLTTAGLVLVNGSDTVSPAIGATSFTFNTAVTSGMGYAVSVQTQPTNATCTVSNATGTVTAAVTSVQVSCSLNTFQIGGTISGLTASGLKLANGIDTVSPAINATSFVFATRVTAGTSYNVTVTAQPTGLSCSLTNSNGTAAANVSNIAVNCKAIPVASWSSATVVGTGVYPWLANDPSATAFFLAWCHCIGGGGVADSTAPSQASRFTDASGWSTPATMAMTQGGALLGLQFDAQGKGFAIWQASTGNIDGSTNPWYSRYTPSSGWSWGQMNFAVQLPPVVTPPGSLLYVSHPPLGLSVSLDGTASAQIHEIARISTNGKPASNNESALSGGASAGIDFLLIGEPNPLMPPSDSTPTYTPGPNGQPYFANTTSWPFDPLTPSTVHGQFATLFNVNNAIQGFGTTTTFNLAMNTSVATGSAITLATIDNPGNAGFYPIRVTKDSTTIAANGDALTTWSVLSPDGSSLTVYAQRYVNGAWLGRQVLFSATDVDYKIYNALPVSALDGAGNGMIVFNSLGTLMAVKLSAATGVFSTATPISSGNSTPVSLRMDALGNAFLLDLYATTGTVRRYDTVTAKWGAPGITFASADIPVLAMDNMGNAMVAWGNSGSIYAARYH